jgi:hypothetical protein
MRRPRRQSNTLNRLYVCGSISARKLPLFKHPTAVTTFSNKLFAAIQLCNFELYFYNLFDNAYLLILRPRDYTPDFLELLACYHVLYEVPIAPDKMIKRATRNDRTYERWDRKLRRGNHNISIFNQILKDSFTHWHNDQEGEDSHGTIWAERFGCELFIEPGPHLIRYLVLHHAANALLHKDENAHGHLVHWGLNDLTDGQNCVARNLASLYNAPIAELAQSLPEQASKLSTLLADGTLRGLSAKELQTHTGVKAFLASELKHIGSKMLVAGLSFGLAALAYPIFKGNRVYGALNLVEDCIKTVMKLSQLPYDLWPAFKDAGWTMELWGEMEPGTPQWSKALKWQPPPASEYADPG